MRPLLLAGLLFAAGAAACERPLESADAPTVSEEPPHVSHMGPMDGGPYDADSGSFDDDEGLEGTIGRGSRPGFLLPATTVGRLDPAIGHIAHP